jgi:hypothetical protein
VAWLQLGAVWGGAGAGVRVPLHQVVLRQHQAGTRLRGVPLPPTVVREQRPVPLPGSVELLPQRLALAGDASGDAGGDASGGGDRGALVAPASTVL